MNKSLAGRNAVITGANQGLGLAIARAYLAAGANVLMCARDAERLDAAAAGLADVTGAGQIVRAAPADVSDPDDVARLATTAFELFHQVHVLVNNAGVYGPFGPSEEVEWSDWKRALEINVYGSVLPSRAFVSHFKQHKYGKIVQLSGGGATNPLPNISAYAASKAAVIRFAESLALELKDHGIDVNAIAPGALATRLLDELIAAGPDAVGADFHDRMVKTKESGGTPLERGASLAVYLGSAESDGITGRLLSAVWDPWESLASRATDLDGSDVYTLRRIVPADRGLTWGNR